MLKRVHIDNYRCLSDFEFRPEPIQLILGENGSGKSAFVQAIWLIRELVCARRTVGALLQSSSRTRWKREAKQSFELEASLPEGEFRYRLLLEYTSGEIFPIIAEERLDFEQRPLFVLGNGLARLESENGEAPNEMPFAEDLSGLGAVLDSPSRPKLAAFKGWLAALVVARPEPDKVNRLSRGFAPAPKLNLSNFTGWFRFLEAKKPGVIRELKSRLSEGAIAGFKDIGSQKLHDKAAFLELLLDTEAAGEPGSTHPYAFWELSEGQRMLIMLHTLVAATLSPARTLILDDPVTHLALREIQPWLNLLLDEARERSAQVILVSHHPEIVNYLANDYGIRFSRERNGRTVVNRFGSGGYDLPPAEILARGWEE